MQQESDRNRIPDALILPGITTHLDIELAEDFDPRITLYDRAEVGYHSMGLESFGDMYDAAFHHGVMLKTRRMFLMGVICHFPCYILEKAIPRYKIPKDREADRVFVITWLDMISPATFSDVCFAIRAEFYRDAPHWLAYARGVRGEKDLKFFDPYIIESVCHRFFPSEKPPVDKKTMKETT